MTRKRRLRFFLCNDCHSLYAPGMELERADNANWDCSHDDELSPEIDLSRAVGLIGFPSMGKTVFLATLHNELMHSFPEWRVEVSDYAFEELTRVFSGLRAGMVAGATYPAGGPNHFAARVYWKKQKLDLLLTDAAGEFYQRLCDDETAWQFPNIGWLLEQYCATFLAIRCGNSGDEMELARLFRKLLQRKHRLKRVVVLLIGIDHYGNELASAERDAIQEFEDQFRSFVGVLKNAGVIMDVVPISNFGFGNSELTQPPAPYNVLEPLRRIVPDYLPWWRRLAVRSNRVNANRPDRSSKSESFLGAKATDTVGTVFISYRRSGGADMARLIRSELVQRGWRVFLDVEDLGAHHFDDRLLLEIQEADNFVLVLSPGSVDSCGGEADWMQREIAHAILTGKNIVPISKEGYQFPSAESLPDNIKDLPRYNRCEYSHVYFDATIQKLQSFLTASSNEQ